MHKIHKTAQMTDKQQKPTHYKKFTQIYTNITTKNKEEKKTWSLKQIYSTKCGRFWAIFKVLARFGMAACKAGASGFLLCGGSISSALWHQYPSDCLLWGIMASLTKSVIALPMVDAACSISSCSTPHFGKEYTVNQ